MPGIADPSRTSARRQRPRLIRSWVILLLWLCAPLASAQDWDYRVRPGDTLWDLAGKHLRTEVSWEQLQAHNQIRDPLALAPGSRLQIPLAWLRQQPAKAKVIAVHGAAHLLRPGESTVSAVAAGQELSIGSRLRTAKDASLSLEFADGSRLMLAGDSELVLDHMTRHGKSGMVDTRVRLPRGRVTNSVEPVRGRAPGFIVETPNASSSVRGTRFRVDASAEGTDTEVVEGTVAVKTGHHQTLLRKGQGTSADAGNAGPLKVVRLLPAPQLLDLPPTLNGARAQVRWQPLPGAVQYRLEIDRGPRFDTLVADLLSVSPEASLPLLAEGRYHLRLRAIDAQGLEGEDVLASFQSELLPEPPYAIAPRHGGVVREPRGEFRWTAATEAGGYRFELADDPAFEQPLLAVSADSAAPLRLPQALSPGQYYWRIASNGKDGRHGPFSDAMGFSLQPLPESGPIKADAGAGGHTFRWRQGEPGQRYRFQMSRSPDFAHLAVDQVVDQAEVTLPKMRRGTWYLRAQAIGSEGYEAPFPSAQQVRIPCQACKIGAAALLLGLLAL